MTTIPDRCLGDGVFVLRWSGHGSKFARRLPHNYDERNFTAFVERALHFDSRELAQAACRVLGEEGAGLVVEPLTPQEKPA